MITELNFLPYIIHYSAVNHPLTNPSGTLSSHLPKSSSLSKMFWPTSEFSFPPTLLKWWAPSRCQTHLLSWDKIYAKILLHCQPFTKVRMNFPNFISSRERTHLQLEKNCIPFLNLSLLYQIYQVRWRTFFLFQSQPFLQLLQYIHTHANTHHIHDKLYPNDSFLYINFWKTSYYHIPELFGGKIPQYFSYNYILTHLFIISYSFLLIAYNTHRII